MRTGSAWSGAALGGAGIAAAVGAVVLGGATADPLPAPDGWRWSVGLDWFLLNLGMMGLTMVPLERAFGRRDDATGRTQGVFRPQWREDLLYFLVSSLFVQGLAFLSLAPAFALRDGMLHLGWFQSVRDAVASQPVVLQFLEIAFLTDLVQYWVHRAFHKVPWLWRFHAVHHSAETLDWLASSRMHVFEVVVLRAFTVVPMYLLGYEEGPLYAYLVYVYLWSAVVHANLRADRAWLKGPRATTLWRLAERLIATPRFHHWHHGKEQAAIDVNFAVHFPVLDRWFGTHHLPPGDGPAAWPDGTGVAHDPPPRGFLGQLAHPFRRAKPSG